MISFVFAIVLLLIVIILFDFYKRRNIISLDFMSKDFTLIIKGIAIIMVILSHVSNLLGYRYLAPFGGAGVTLFLIVSAYGLEFSYQKNGLKNFWRKRILAVMVVYWLIRIINYVLNIGKYNLSNIILDLTLIKPLNPNGWYMTYIAFCYVVFYFVTKFIKEDTKRYFTLLIVYLLTTLLSNELWVEQFLSFPMGLLIYKYRNHNVVSQKRCLFFLIGFMTFFIIKQLPIIRYLPINIIWFIQMVYKLLLAMFIVNFVNIFYSKFNLLKYGVLNIGIISYELYLIHGYFFELVRSEKLKCIILFYIFSFILSIIAYYICNKVRGKLSGGRKSIIKDARIK